MLFAFTTWNHCREGRIIVQDITENLGHQLRALGHEVTWSEEPEFTRSGYNVVLESFADNPDTLQRMRIARCRGARFLIVATEEPTGNGFNHGLEPAMIDRQNAFPDAARLCDGILHLIPGDAVNSWYARLAPAAYAEMGYAPGLVATDHAEPAHDVGFYGKPTWRRDMILGKLQERGCSVLRLSSLDVPRVERDAQMRRARVIVTIRANEEWPMVSSTRCASALFLGRPVIAEPHPYADPWDKVVDFSSSLEAFYDDVVAAVRGDWRDRHRRQLARFAEHLPPERCVGEPLRRIGII